MKSFFVALITFLLFAVPAFATCDEGFIPLEEASKCLAEGQGQSAPATLQSVPSAPVSPPPPARVVEQAPPPAPTPVVVPRPTPAPPPPQAVEKLQSQSCQYPATNEWQRRAEDAAGQCINPPGEEWAFLNSRPYCAEKGGSLHGATCVDEYTRQPRSPAADHWPGLLGPSADNQSGYAPVPVTRGYVDLGPAPNFSYVYIGVGRRRR